MAGCSASRQIPDTSTQAPPAPNYRSFSHSSTNVFRSLEKVLYNRGYIVTSRDERGGAITAEHYTTTPLQEDQAPVQPAGPSAGQVILVILGIIFIVGLIYIIVDSASSSNHASNEKEEHHDNDHGEHYEDHHASTTVAYKYIVSIRTTAVTDTSSRVEVQTTKVIIENGTPTSSAAIESSATLNNFFDALENELAFQH
jgi:hypothetical protein